MQTKTKRALRGLIAHRYGSQSDFAAANGIREDRLSRLICGRDFARKEEIKIFKRALGARAVEILKRTADAAARQRRCHEIDSS